MLYIYTQTELLIKTSTYLYGPGAQEGIAIYRQTACNKYPQKITRFTGFSLINKSLMATLNIYLLELD